MRRASYFDIVEKDDTFHPKIERVKRMQDAIKYVCKEGNVASKGIDWEMALLNAKTKQSIPAAVICQMLVDNPEVTMKELIGLEPRYMMSNLNKVKAFKMELLKISALDRTLKTFNGCIPSTVSWTMDPVGSSPSAIQIAKWVNTNFTTSPRNHKMKQLWIHGSTGLGKSRLIWKLMKYFRGYEIPNDSGWFDDFDNGFEFLYVDEFRGHITVRMLNSLAEGRLMSLPRRGTSPILKTRNVPVIICSNLSPYEVYSKCTPVSLDAIIARFKIVYLPGPFNLHFCKDDNSSDEDTAPLMSDNE